MHNDDQKSTVSCFFYLQKIFLNNGQIREAKFIGFMERFTDTKSGQIREAKFIGFMQRFTDTTKSGQIRKAKLIGFIQRFTDIKSGQIREAKFRDFMRRFAAGLKEQIYTTATRLLVLIELMYLYHKYKKV